MMWRSLPPRFNKEGRNCKSYKNKPK